MKTYPPSHPLAILRNAVTGKIQRGKAQAITGQPAPMQFVVLDNSPSARFCYVAARPGYYRAKDGRQVRDGSCPLTSGPEMSDNSRHALRFPSHRAAARVASKLGNARIVTV
jgi:hypothetical protein